MQHPLSRHPSGRRALPPPQGYRYRYPAIVDRGCLCRRHPTGRRTR